MGELTEIVAPIPSIPQIIAAIATPSQKCFGNERSPTGIRGIAMPSGGVHEIDICFASCITPGRTSEGVFGSVIIIPRLLGYGHTYITIQP